MVLRSRSPMSGVPVPVADMEVSVPPPSRCPMFFSPKTKLQWIPRRSLCIGVTSFCYAAPFVWGAWPLYLLQALPSFMSDFVMTGKDSWWHPADRTLAISNSILTVISAFWAIQWWGVPLLVIATYINYGLSVFFIRNKNFSGYEIAHTLWHLVGSASISYVVSNGCGPSPFWADGCERKWVGGLYCNCL